MRPVFLDEPPKGATITNYDRAHFTLYLRLLDADVIDADWRDVVTRLFGLDPLAEPERAQRIYVAHLSRARWLTEQGYRTLLSRPGQHEG